MKDTQNDLHDLFLDELADLLDAENQLIKALPKMAAAAKSPQLSQAFKEHLEQTKNHAARLDEVFEALGETPEEKPCKAMKGLLAEGEEMMKEQQGSAALDAALIAAAQKVEHYEIASYGTVCEWAEQMEHTEAADILAETLEEEKMADAKLTGIAKSLANQQAEQGQANKRKAA